MMLNITKAYLHTPSLHSLTPSEATATQAIPTVSGQKETVAETRIEREANSPKRGTMNKTQDEKRNKSGCCAFLHAFLRLFKRKKRGRRSFSERLSKVELEKPTLEATPLEESLSCVTLLNDCVVYENVGNEGGMEEPAGMEWDECVEEIVMEEEFVEEIVIEEHLIEITDWRRSWWRMCY